MNLKEKLLKVMQECAHIGRDAFNDEVGYPYVTAAKINDAVNSALTAAGIATTAESKLVDIRTIGEKVLATVEVKINLYDAASDEQFSISGVGSGIDNGDKSVAKAQTMAVKYAWKGSLLIADSSDDPDAVGGKIQPLKNSASKSAISAKNSANEFKAPF